VHSLKRQPNISLKKIENGTYLKNSKEQTMRQVIRNKCPLNRFDLLIVFTIGMVTYPTLALADGETPIAGGLSYIINAMTGATGMAIATIAVIAVGLLCLGHYLEWKRLLQTVVGISIIFGAPLIVRGIIYLTRSGGM
jgi:type IV secretory pathway VirB2 component (pilin)